MSTRKNTNQSGTDIMQFLTDNEDKLRILLSGSKDEIPLKYKFKGKKATKTIFMSVKLQYLINEFCIENEMKIGEVMEIAAVEFLVRCGWSEKLQEIMDSSKKAGEAGEIC